MLAKINYNLKSCRIIDLLNSARKYVLSEVFKICLMLIKSTNTTIYIVNTWHMWPLTYSRLTFPFLVGWIFTSNINTEYHSFCHSCSCLVVFKVLLDIQEVFFNILENTINSQWDQNNNFIVKISMISYCLFSILLLRNIFVCNIANSQVCWFVK